MILANEVVNGFKTNDPLVRVDLGGCQRTKHDLVGLRRKLVVEVSVTWSTQDDGVGVDGPDLG